MTRRSGSEGFAERRKERDRFVTSVLNSLGLAAGFAANEAATVHGDDGSIFENDAVRLVLERDGAFAASPTSNAATPNSPRPSVA